MTAQQQALIKEINQHIKDALGQWSDILVESDATNTSYHFDYDDTDVINALHILFCVAQNYGIKRGAINNENATSLAKNMHDVILAMTGIDTIEFYNKH